MLLFIIEQEFKNKLMANAIAYINFDSVIMGKN